MVVDFSLDLPFVQWIVVSLNASCDAAAEPVPGMMRRKEDWKVGREKERS